MSKTRTSRWVWVAMFGCCCVGAGVWLSFGIAGALVAFGAALVVMASIIASSRELMFTEGDM